FPPGQPPTERVVKAHVQPRLGIAHGREAIEDRVEDFGARSIRAKLGGTEGFVAKHLQSSGDVALAHGVVSSTVSRASSSLASCCSLRASRSRSCPVTSFISRNASVVGLAASTAVSAKA